MKLIKLLGLITITVLLSLIFVPYAYAEWSFFPVKQIINDFEFINDDAWSYGTYLANETSYVQWNEEKFFLHVIDNTTNDSFGWGFLHQGIQLHNWGAEENLPLKEEFLIKKNIQAKPNTWFFKIKLRRGDITWFDVPDSSIPEWLKNMGGKGQFAIGLMFAFETSNVDYLGSIKESTILQFEVQFVRVRWNGTNEITLYDDFFLYAPPYDYDVHNIYVPNGRWCNYITPSKQMVANKTYEYVVDCGALLDYAWNKWYGLFPVNECRLRYVNFYVETLNCACDCEVDYIDVYSQPSWTFRYCLGIIGVIVVIGFVFIVAIKMFS